MKMSLICFGLGALLATIGAAFAYLYQHSVTMSWQKDLLHHGSGECLIYRTCAFVVLICSLCSFAVGGIFYIL